MERKPAIRTIFRFRADRPLNGAADTAFSPEVAVLPPLVPARAAAETEEVTAQSHQQGAPVSPLQGPEQEQKATAPSAKARWLIPVVEQILLEGVQLGREIRKLRGHEPGEKPPHTG